MMLSNYSRCHAVLMYKTFRPPLCRYTSISRPTFRTQKKGLGATGYILAVVPVAAFCLGTWQVQRKKWKDDLIQRLQERTSMPPSQLPYDLEEISQMEFQRVQVRGHFDHSREMYVRPRSLLSSKSEGGGSLMSSGQVGSWVVTPFVLDDRDCTILVNRGWVPKSKTLQSERHEKLVHDNIELEGIVRLTEKRVPFASKYLTNDKISWNRRDVDAMAETIGCQPIFIDAVKESSQPGGPIGGQTRVTLRNEHLSYIITWYSLSAATAFLWYFKIFK